MRSPGHGWRECAEAARSGGRADAPVLGIVGAVHGDEIAGAELVNAYAERPSPDPCAWSLRFAVGNPRALAAKRRYIDSDLNRAFGAEVPAIGHEAERAATLKGVFEGTQVLLDVHQTHCETPALIVTKDTPTHLAFARALGVRIAVVDAQKVYGPTMLSDWVDAKGGLGVTLESGQVGSDHAKDAAAQVIRRLVARDWDPGPSIRVYAVRAVMRAPWAQLNFKRRLANTSPVRSGEVLAEQGGLMLRAPADGAVLLPQRDVAEDRGDVRVDHRTWQEALGCA